MRGQIALSLGLSAAVLQDLMNLGSGQARLAGLSLSNRRFECPSVKCFYFLPYVRPNGNTAGTRVLANLNK